MILVTGATGLVGRHIVDALLCQGAKVRATTRVPETAGLPDAVDLADAGSAASLDGVEALFLHPRATTDPIGLLAEARAAGVRKVVALAAMNVDDPLDEQPSRLTGDRNRETENAAVASGLQWTSLRPSTFASNTGRSFGPQVRAGDVVRYVYPSFEESPIHERDLAAVAAHALLTDELTGRRVDLTGPHSLSHRSMVSIIGSVLGRPLRFAEIPPEAAVRAMTAAGLPAPFVSALMARYARHLDRPQHPANDAVRMILDRPALTYAEWVADNTATFRN
jgi:uncharacterized protein YbjT (DUF2867 family)